MIDETAVQPEGRSHAKDSFYYLFLVALPLVAVLFMEHRYPILYVHLIAEDRVGEYATAIAFATACGFFMASGSKASGLNRVFLFTMAFLGLVVAAEEVSWGQRIIGIDTPEALRAINRQGEITLHNIGSLQGSKTQKVAGVLLQILMLISALQTRLSSRFIWMSSLSLPPISFWPATVLVSFLLIAMPLVKGDEISEIFLAFAILIWSIMSAYEMNAVRFDPRVFVPAVAGSVLLGAMALSSSLDADMSWRYNISASRDFPNAGMMEQSRALFEYILARPALVQPSTGPDFDRLHN